MNNIEQRLKSNLVNEKVDALFDTFELGIEGIKLIASALQDKEREVRQYAWFLLSESDLAIAKQTLYNYLPLSKIDCLHTVTEFGENTNYFAPDYFAISDYHHTLVCYSDIGYKTSYVDIWNLPTGKKLSNFQLTAHEFGLGKRGQIYIQKFQDAIFALRSNTFKPIGSFPENLIRSTYDSYFNVCLKIRSLLATGGSIEKKGKLEIWDYENCNLYIGYDFEKLTLRSDYQTKSRNVINHLASPLIFTSDGDFFVANFFDYQHNSIIKIWNIDTKKLIQTLDNLPRLAITSLGINLDRKIIACGIREDKICVWELQSDSIIYTVDEIAPCIISDDGRILIHATANYEIVIRDLINNKALNILRGHKAPIMHLTMSEDREFIASYSSDKTIKIWGIV